MYKKVSFYGCDNIQLIDTKDGVYFVKKKDDDIVSLLNETGYFILQNANGKSFDEIVDTIISNINSEIDREIIEQDCTEYLKILIELKYIYIINNV